MEPISFATGVIGAVEPCIKLGIALVDGCKAYRGANARVESLITRIEAVWVKTEHQASLLTKIGKHLPERLLKSQEGLLLELQLQLQTATAGLHGLSGTTQDTDLVTVLGHLKLRTSQRARYALLEKHLQKVADELEAWQGRFDPSWLLITLIGEPQIDQLLTSQKSDEIGPAVQTVRLIRKHIHNVNSSSTSQQSVIRQPSFISSGCYLLPDSDCAISRTQDGKAVLIDTTAYPGGTDMVEIVKSACFLADVLAQCDASTVCLLKCLGIIEHVDVKTGLPQLQLLYQMPSGYGSVYSLRYLIKDSVISLDWRFRIARQLARAVASVHAASFVHKNIRPETVMIFQSSIGHPMVSFLVGFEQFRSDATLTVKVGDMAWERNLYRHPKRQGMHPEDVYVMQHDIYSLGVCLLELGIGSSFVTEDSGSGSGPNNVLEIDQLLTQSNKRDAAREIKNRLIVLAESELPGRMGIKYKDIVLTCLKCTDGGTSNFPSYLLENDGDLDGIKVGLVFIEKILDKLESISV